MTKQVKRLKVKPANPLEQHVLDWINERAEDYESGPVGVLKDLAHGGSSGIISHLIYTTDCVAFYDKYQADIDAILKELIESTGESPSNLFKRAGWDDSDPLAREDGNKNILAWFGFEECARNLGQRAGIEL